MSGRGKSHDSRYIPNVLTLIREHRSFFLGTTLAALALRLFFFVYFPAVTDDSRVYADLATNWLQHGVYGQTQAARRKLTSCRPTRACRDIPCFWLRSSGYLGLATSKQSC